MIHPIKRAALITLFAAALSGTAFAGSKSNFAVYISTANSHVMGNVTATRATADAMSSIGCSFYGQSYGACYAEDSAGTFAMCYWSGAGWATVVSAVSASSYIEFSYDSGGNCTNIAVDNDSMNLP